MRIDLTKDEVLEYSSHYVYDADDKLGQRLQAAVAQGYMTRDDLIEVARWKWRGGRTRQLAAQNTEDEVREISRVSFAAKSERLRIGALLALRGVHWPMASVILHFAFPDRYPPASLVRSPLSSSARQNVRRTRRIAVPLSPALAAV